MIRVEKYDERYKATWDSFIAASKNGLFLFYRDYMEYHSDRFADHSLMFFDEDRLIALMPANVKDDVLISHGGLTFGGIVSGAGMKMSLMIDLFDSLAGFLKERDISRLIYKAIPHIYHTVPAEEDLYALFRHGAHLFRRDVSSTIDRRHDIPLSKGRRWAIKQARKNGLRVEQSFDFETFMAIEERVLAARHNVRPAHTAEEIALLAGRFPDNIQLFGAYREDRLLGGAIMYESRNVAHVQYMCASDEGRECGALDIVLDFLIHQRCAQKRYFDFGISTEDEGLYLNPGLTENKESFGARTTLYDFYSLDI
jgi:hypothetical protein